MTTSTPGAPAGRTGWNWELLHVPALGALAITQPLLDVLGRGATFFVAHRFSPADVALLVVLLLALPLPLVLAEVVAARYSRRAAVAVRLGAVALLVALIALHALARGGASAGRSAVPVALAAGAAFAWAYRRWQGVRQFTSFLGLALLAVPAVFFANPEVRGLAASGPARTGTAPTPGARPPIVMVIFDELPVTSLMGPDRGIDARRFPNFAALAARSDWYRSAVATSDTTEYAIPALLSGRLPKPGTLPQVASFPDNLFTALGRSYRIYAREALSQLCPPELNRLAREEAPAHERWATLLSDLAVVYGHVVLPVPLRTRLPPISAAWRGFGRTDAPVAARTSALSEPTLGSATVAAHETLGDDRAAAFRSFVATIARRDEPSLYFLHILLPHVPWQYTPSGKLYSVPGQLVPGLYEERWIDDPFLTTQAYQRYLHQLQFLDTLLGELLHRLASAGIQDEVALVVTADHGVSFRPGDSRRELSATNRQDILPVPLFIKAPGQRAGRIVDRPVSALSTLPTLFDLLALPSPWPMEAASLLAPGPTTPRRATSKAGGAFEVPAGVDEEKWRTLEEKLRLFGAEAAAFDGGGPRPDLLGLPVGQLPREPDLRVAEMSIDGAGLFADVDPASSYAPVYVSGALGEFDERSDLAIAVNGTIRATTRPYRPLDSQPRFGALVAERDLRAGTNRVEVLALLGPPGATRVRRLVPLGGSPARLETSTAGGPAALVTGESRTEVVPGALEGQAWAYSIGDRFAVAGWAWDRANNQPPADVVVFLRGEEIYSGSTTDVAEVQPAPSRPRASARATFRFDLPSALVPGLERSGVRVFARARSGVAAELQYSYQLQVAAPAVAAAGAATTPRWEIRVSDGRVIPVAASALDGRLEGTGPRADGRPGIELTGWAAEPGSGRPAAQILVFNGGALLVRGTTGADLPDSQAPRGRSMPRAAGFRLQADVPASEIADLRVFAVAEGGVAAELEGTDATAVELVRSPVGVPVAIRRAGIATPLRADAVRGFLREVRAGDGFVWVRGWAIDVDHAAEPRALLVFHRGRLVAAGRASGIRVDVNRLFRVPDQSLRSGFEIPVAAERIENLEGEGVQVVALSAAGEASLLGAVLVLEREGPGTTGIRSSDGRFFRALPNAIAGLVEVRRPTPSGVSLTGWAVSRDEPGAPVSILVFAGERQVARLRPDTPRPDVARRLGLGEIAPAGFAFVVPRESLPGRGEDLRVYALTRAGVVGELPEAAPNSAQRGGGGSGPPVASARNSGHADPKPAETRQRQRQRRHHPGHP